MNMKTPFSHLSFSYIMCVSQYCRPILCWLCESCLVYVALFNLLDAGLPSPPTAGRDSGRINYNNKEREKGQGGKTRRRPDSGASGSRSGCRGLPLPAIVPSGEIHKRLAVMSGPRAAAAAAALVVAVVAWAGSSSAEGAGARFDLFLPEAEVSRLLGEREAGFSAAVFCSHSLFKVCRECRTQASFPTQSSRRGRRRNQRRYKGLTSLG